MSKPSYYITFFKIFILFIGVFSVLRNLSFNGIIPYSVVLSIRIFTIGLIILMIFDNFEKQNKNVIWPVKLFLIWNIVCIARGIFIAENYWEWKFLVDSGLVMLIPLIAYIFMSKFLVQQILSFWLKYMLVLFFIFMPFATSSNFHGMYLNPILFFLLIIPLLPFKWKIIVIFCFILVLMAGFDARSNIIRFSLATILGFVYYFRAFISLWTFKLLHAIFMVLPIILLLLALFNVFNVFKMNEYIKGNYYVSSSANNNKKDSLTADTRTELYVENINSALKHHYVLIGRTPANGYDSKSFGNYLKFLLHTGKLQRFTSEVAILNIFLWGGIIGAILYFLVFFRASYLAIYRSNNYFVKIIGVFVAFRWSYAFVEDFTAFEIQYITLWLLVSMCYSREFRKMSDLDFQHWVQGIFIKSNDATSAKLMQNTKREISCSKN